GRRRSARRCGTWSIGCSRARPKTSSWAWWRRASSAPSGSSACSRCWRAGGEGGVGNLERALLGFLLNALWQAPPLAGAGALPARGLPRAPAAHPPRLWLTALALALFSPLNAAWGSAARVQPKDRPPARPVAGIPAGPEGSTDAGRAGPWLTVALPFSR